MISKINNKINNKNNKNNNIKIYYISINNKK